MNTKGDPDCPVCHGTGWDGDGYTLCCAHCSPSVMDLHVDKTCGRKRDKNGKLIIDDKDSDNNYCKWSYTEGSYGYWESGCGKTYHGNISDFDFCPYCRKQIEKETE